MHNTANLGVALSSKYSFENRLKFEKISRKQNKHCVCSFLTVFYLEKNPLNLETLSKISKKFREELIFQTKSAEVTNDLEKHDLTISCDFQKSKKSGVIGVGVRTKYGRECGQRYLV